MSIDAGSQGLDMVVRTSSHCLRTGSCLQNGFGFGHGGVLGDSGQDRKRTSMFAECCNERYCFFGGLT